MADEEITPLESQKKPKVTTLRLQEMKQAGEKISALTAYDFLTAQLLDDAGIDLILVGDSASMVFAGHDTTLPMTMHDMIYHARVVNRAVRRALVVVDMPFMSYHQGEDEALANAGRLMQDGRGEAVKLEGGKSISRVVERIVDAGIPVLGHVGLRPQSIHLYGTYKERGTNEKEAEEIFENARIMQDSGAFGVVIEKVPASLAQRVTEHLTIPTIGIGAGRFTDGQVLVVADVLGTNDLDLKHVVQYDDFTARG
ncbi:MAG: 3-methyl-2-oxobutanoate hydroxymethyltransferase, partial [Planctomycetota bacterium]|nr:3-methyl-2-oxobutanoate hydroxymethyltransferase [Planctomycetota bacterium]